jgi:hypothetical protein
MVSDINLVATTISVIGAVASWAGYLLNRASALDASRPELVLTDWAYDPDNTEGKITIKGIKNVGRGAALHALFMSDPDSIREGYAPTYIAITEKFTVIAPGEAVPLEAEITIFWKNIGASSEPLVKMTQIGLILFSSDTRGMIYQTDYRLRAFNPSNTLRGMHQFAPGLHGTRQVKREPSWKRRMDGKLRGAWSKFRKSLNEAQTDLIGWPWRTRN